MASCLGMYVDTNLIKYAKVSKENDKFKVESFGVKFYEKLGDAVSQIIEETYSYKIPISVNLSDEMYEYFNMFALLNKKDLDKAIKTEFEALCSEKGYNPRVFETRYAVVENVSDSEKLKIIHISSNKIDINNMTQNLDGCKIAGMFPIPMALPNLVEVDPKENVMFVNIENRTTITTVINQKIYDVKKIEQGTQEILSKINTKENSYAKSYDVCKETTIYTAGGSELTEEQTGYLEDIMPTLYQILGQIQKAINTSEEKITRVYISGIAALINNIDLYFQEYLDGVTCEILKPNFINITPEINIKDYIEVNSAISLGLIGLGKGVAGINFKEEKGWEQLKQMLKVEVNPDKKGSSKKMAGNLLTNDLKEPLDATEKSLLRIAFTILILFIIYGSFSKMLETQINKKNDQAKEAISATNSQIALANEDNERIKTKTNQYDTKIANLQEINEKISNKNKTKKAIPSLLNQLMYIIPEEVQVTSIQNTSNTHIEITAQSPKYEQLGFLTAKIKTEEMLTNVISTAGQKNNDVVTIKIEGDLP